MLSSKILFGRGHAVGLRRYRTTGGQRENIERDENSRSNEVERSKLLVTLKKPSEKI